jgi:hypothetical protein
MNPISIGQRVPYDREEGRSTGRLEFAGPEVEVRKRILKSRCVLPGLARSWKRAEVIMASIGILRKCVVAAIVVMAASARMSLGQGPLHKQVNFDINVAYSLRMGHYLLPAGHYILYQINANDLNLFALYLNVMTHPPIAMIRTVRIDYAVTGWPEKTRMLLSIDESSPDQHPVILGWNIPGDDGWQIISVVPKNNSVLARTK